jgi:hypothetical protein
MQTWYFQDLFLGYMVAATGMHMRKHAITDRLQGGQAELQK